MKLRLLVTAHCDRACEGCCNKGFDLEGLPVVQSFKGFDEIILTGGEPLLRPDRIVNLIRWIRSHSPAPIYLYTARPVAVPIVLPHLDGITLTLHDPKDEGDMARLSLELKKDPKKSMRLHAFKGVDVSQIDLSAWDEVRTDLEWIEDCPLPEGELFMRTEEIR